MLRRHAVTVPEPVSGPTRLRLGHDALQNLLRGRAPGADLHAVLLFEGRVQRRDVLGGKRRIEAEEALAARAFEQELRAVRALVRSQSREHAPRLLRRDGRSETRGCEQSAQGFHPPGTVSAGPFSPIATPSAGATSR